MANATRPSRPRWGFRLGVALLAAGALLLAAAGAYYGYGVFASRWFDDLVVRNPNASELLAQPTPTPAAAVPPLPTSTKPTAPTPDGGAQPDPTPTTPHGQAPELAALYPGALIPARQWADPRGTIALVQPDLDGFTPVSSYGRPVINGHAGRAERIIVPQLHIDAPVEELVVADLAASVAYETPKFVVGHIPATPNPGSHGNGWYFGHLESPVEGEGNVFLTLPRVSALLRDGEDVHVILRADGRDYLYAVSDSNLIPQEELSLYGADNARITLVTCYPRLRYDHRLLVTGLLIGFRDVAPA